MRCREYIVRCAKHTIGTSALPVGRHVPTELEDELVGRLDPALIETCWVVQIGLPSPGDCEVYDLAHHVVRGQEHAVRPHGRGRYDHPGSIVRIDHLDRVIGSDVVRCSDDAVRARPNKPVLLIADRAIAVVVAREAWSAGIWHHGVSQRHKHILDLLLVSGDVDVDLGRCNRIALEFQRVGQCLPFDFDLHRGLERPGGEGVERPHGSSIPAQGLGGLCTGGRVDVEQGDVPSRKREHGVHVPRKFVGQLLGSHHMARAVRQRLHEQAVEARTGGIERGHESPDGEGLIDQHRARRMFRISCHMQARCIELIDGQVRQGDILHVDPDRAGLPWRHFKGIDWQPLHELTDRSVGHYLQHQVGSVTTCNRRRGVAEHHREEVTVLGKQVVVQPGNRGFGAQVDDRLRVHALRTAADADRCAGVVDGIEGVGTVRHPGRGRVPSVDVAFAHYPIVGTDVDGRIEKLDATIDQVIDRLARHPLGQRRIRQIVLDLGQQRRDVEGKHRVVAAVGAIQRLAVRRERHVVHERVRDRPGGRDQLGRAVEAEGILDDTDVTAGRMRRVIVGIVRRVFLDEPVESRHECVGQVRQHGDTDDVVHIEVV